MWDRPRPCRRRAETGPRGLRLGVAWLAGVLLAGCNGGLGPDMTGTTLPEADSVRAGAAFIQSEYRIAPQDTLEITVYQFPTLSRVTQVDSAGRLSLPLVGAVVAAGKTVGELEMELTRKLGARYIQSPQVSVLVKESIGARVTVDGAVKLPGVYTLKGKTTLVQALALAQGINEVGDTTVTLTRIADGRPVSARIDVASIRAGQAPDPQVFGGDTIVVDESAARTGLQVLKNTVPAAIGIGVRAVP
jgi:polysaccharide export outer membrane protein